MIQFLRRFWRGLVKRELLVLIVALILLCPALAGCTKSRSQSRGQIVGTIDGKEVILETRQTSVGTTGVEVGPMLNAGLSALRGDMTKAMADMAASMKPLSEDQLKKLLEEEIAKRSGMSPETAGLSAAMLSAIVAAVLAHLRGSEHKKDAAEGWALALKDKEHK